MSDARPKLSRRRPGFLLFESGCLTCTHMAETVTELSDGALVARSLHEKEIQDLLDANAPGWRPRPMLIRFMDDGAVRIHTGASMVGVLARTLGPRRCVALTRLMGEDKDRSADIRPDGISRRAALLRGGALVGAVALGSTAVTSSAWGSRWMSRGSSSPGFHDSDRATLSRLRHSPEVRRAIEHLGPVDWNRASSDGEVYILRHTTPRSPATATYTATDSEGVALSYAFIEKGGSTLIEWMLPDGHHLTTTSIRSKGNKLQVEDASSAGVAPMCSAAVSAVSPDAISKERLEFLIACMSFNLKHQISAQCVYDCYNCAHGSLPGCVSCTNCAGVTGLKQLKSCLQGCPPA